MARLIDGRELDPPKPLQQVLAALDDLAHGDELKVLLHCHPTPLFSVLRRHGYTWEETVRDNGTHEIRIWRAP